MTTPQFPVNSIEYLVNKVEQRMKQVEQAGLDFDVWEFFREKSNQTIREYDAVFRMNKENGKYQRELTNYYNKYIFEPMDDEIWKLLLKEGNRIIKEQNDRNKC